MSEIDIKDLNSGDVPFFARYLEGQLEPLSEAEVETVLGGKTGGGSKKLSDGPQTLKFPSDQEDGRPPDAMTQKFPSDGNDCVPPPEF
ncbi:MAG: microviridin/marinostatin family tricyclic proteinase inhibitor [Hydrococcus sp. RM1_1_31]|nr:microviridin/marinostatin family tricyclic proteinase inhibitor [Hydrococcus sp. RM1_1_31]